MTVGFVRAWAVGGMVTAICVETFAWMGAFAVRRALLGYVSGRPVS